VYPKKQIKGKNNVMKETSGNNVLQLIIGILFIGGAVAVLNLYRSASDIEYSHKNVYEEYDGDIFV